jgi:hypothetical protein
VNAAESIVKALAVQAGCPWRFLNFYDVQTFNGFDDKKKGSFEIDKLIVTGTPDAPNVNDWEPVAKSPHFTGRDGISDVTKLPGIPPEVFAQFEPYINEEFQE